MERQTNILTRNAGTPKKITRAEMMVVGKCCNKNQHFNNPTSDIHHLLGHLYLILTRVAMKSYYTISEQSFVINQDMNCYPLT